MYETITITFSCPCEKNYLFQHSFKVKGLGMSEVQVYCPHPQCPMKDKLLTYDIPWELAKNETNFKGVDKQHPPTKS